MKMQQTKPTPPSYDNQGVLKLAKNLTFHKHTKHVEIHCLFNRQLLEDGSIKLQYCPTEDQTVEFFTMSLGLEKYVKFQGKLGVVGSLTINGGC